MQLHANYLISTQAVYSCAREVYITDGSLLGGAKVFFPIVIYEFHQDYPLTPLFTKDVHRA